MNSGTAASTKNATTVYDLAVMQKLRNCFMARYRRQTAAVFQAGGVDNGDLDASDASFDDDQGTDAFHEEAMTHQRCRLSDVNRRVESRTSLVAAEDIDGGSRPDTATAAAAPSGGLAAIAAAAQASARGLLDQATAWARLSQARRVDVRAAKAELWHCVQQLGPTSRLSLMRTATPQPAPGDSAGPDRRSLPTLAGGLSPQMAFICLLHLANEFGLVLESCHGFGRYPSRPYR